MFIYFTHLSTVDAEVENSDRVLIQAPKQNVVSLQTLLFRFPGGFLHKPQHRGWTDVRVHFSVNGQFILMTGRWRAECRITSVKTVSMIRCSLHLLKVQESLLKRKQNRKLKISSTFFSFFLCSFFSPAILCSEPFVFSIWLDCSLPVASALILWTRSSWRGNWTVFTGQLLCK